MMLFKMKMRNGTEQNTKNAIMEYLKMRPDVFVMKMNTGGTPYEYKSNKSGQIKKYFVRFGSPGMADIQGVLNRKIGNSYIGQALYIEVKARGCTKKQDGVYRQAGEQKPDQIEFEKKVKAMGAIYLLAFSVQDVIEGLKEAALSTPSVTQP